MKEDIKRWDGGIPLFGAHLAIHLATLTWLGDKIDESHEENVFGASLAIYRVALTTLSDKKIDEP